MPHFWSKQLFWIGFFFTGFVFTVVIYLLSAVREKVLRVPKGMQRIFVMTFYLLPSLVLPLLPQPRLSWPISAGIGAGLTLLITMTAIRVMARRELGTFPVLRQKANLVTTGIYGQLRHPMYLSNILLAAGWALLFRGIHALQCVPIWTFCYVVLTFFEEKGLVEEYGRNIENTGEGCGIVLFHTCFEEAAMSILVRLYPLDSGRCSCYTCSIGG